MYQPHPSARLSRLFAERPWQGAHPFDAKFLFVGLDANYHPDIESSPTFESVVEYHADGVAFWKRHAVHHPFLLPGYTGDGKRFHRTFGRIGFTPAEADKVSFIELLAVPTAGRSSLVAADLDSAHLKLLHGAMFEGRARHVFVSGGVARLMRQTGRFPQLAKNATGDGPLPTLHSDSERTVYQHLHFSNYGKFQAQLNRELLAIAALR